MLFKVIASEDIFETNPRLRAVPEFSDCTSRELKYIFLMYDYDTILKKLPIEQRHEQALLISGYRKEKDGSRMDRNARDTMNGKIPRVQEAIGRFKAMQYDEEKETLRDIDSHIRQIKDFIRSDKKNDATKIKNATEMVMQLNKLYEERKKLATLLEVREETAQEEEVEEEIHVNRTLSTLDKINQEMNG